MKLSRELKTGILAIGSILLFIFGYSYLKGTNLLEKQRVYYVKYKNVEGLAESAPVTLNGLTVGKVQEINFADASGDLVVTFSLDNEFKFSKNSVVQIYSSGFIGGNNLGIKPVYEPNNEAKPGDTLKGEIQQGILDQVTGKLAPLEAKVQSTLTNLDTLLIGLSDVLDGKTRKNLKSSIANLNVTLSEFRGASKTVNELLQDNQEKFNNTITNLDRTTENFATLSDSLSQIEVGKLVKDLENITSRFNNIVAQIENGDGSLGKLLKDEKLYDNLSGASLQLELLLEDMKLNPKRYVHFSIFGKRPKPYENPEGTNE